jgi:acetyl-CoA synthetase
MPDKPATLAPEVNIDSVLQEQRKFECPEDFRRQAHIKSLEEYERIYRESVEGPEKFWGRIAEELHWFKKWDKV